MKTLLTNAIINNVKQNLLIDNEVITYVGNQNPQAETIIDLSGKHIIPGMIDPHTHVRDLQQKDKEDWTSASMAAIKGGVTTVFDMPNNKPATTNLTHLKLKREAARKSLVNYRFNIAATTDNYDEIVEMLESENTDISAIKLFLAGSNASDFVNDDEIIKRFFELSLQYQLPIIVHTEWQACLDKYVSKVSNPTVLQHHFLRNKECAILGTEKVVKIAKQIGNKLVVAHTSLKEEIEIIRANKKNTAIYCEVSPHHLLLNETVLQKTGNFGKVNPPLRTKQDNLALWQGISDGTVDFIGSDHAPHQLFEKNQSYAMAPSGFPGLETSLPLLLNEVRNNRLSLDKLIEITSTNTANIFNIANSGKIIPDYDADLVVFDLHQTEKVSPRHFKTKAKYSPFNQMTIIPVEMTIIKGKIYKQTY